jgi:hypothetical protein
VHGGVHGSMHDSFAQRSAIAVQCCKFLMLVPSRQPERVMHGLQVFEHVLTSQNRAGRRLGYILCK